MITSSPVFFAAEIIGTIGFALSGSMVGLKAGLDIFGLILLAVITALGGGVLRDLCIGRIPPGMFLDYRYLVVAIVTSAVVFFVARYARANYKRYEENLTVLNNVFDAIGLGAFVVVGIEAGISAGYGNNGFFLIFLGVITCIGGGMMRDLLVQQVPVVLHKQVYALPCIVDACIYLLPKRIDVNDFVSASTAMGIIFVLRMLATKNNWNLPRA